MGVRDYIIEGGSCSGKTSVCRELQRRGYQAFNGDTDLAYQGHPETGDPASHLACGSMLAELTGDHCGTTGHYYFDVPFEETVRRHLFRAQRNDFTAHEMREWFDSLDPLRSLDQRVVPATSTAVETVEMIFEHMGFEEPARLGSSRLLPGSSRQQDRLVGQTHAVCGSCV